MQWGSRWLRLACTGGMSSKACQAVLLQDIPELRPATALHWEDQGNTTCSPHHLVIEGIAAPCQHDIKPLKFGGM